METPAYISLLREPVAMWIANVNLENVPEVVRCMGIVPTNNAVQLTVFLPEVWSRQFIRNLETAKQLSFLTTSVPTYESYQYKGRFISIRACTADEIEIQNNYRDGFAEEIAKIGLNKQALYQSYVQQPSWALTMEVTEIFNQTPCKGTGGQVSGRTLDHE